MEISGKPIDYDIVIFDLGGVIIELTGVQKMIEWCGGEIDEPELWRRWLRCESARQFESGKIPVESFGNDIVAEMSLLASPEEFINGFRSWIGGVYHGASELLERLRGRHQVGCLSNTNSIHWERMSSLGLDTQFDHYFLSHLIGMMKPDREIFDHVAEALDLPHERILYFDDNMLNVDAAREAGMHAFQTKGVVQATTILTEIGII